jgi:hypothetical protein
MAGVTRIRVPAWLRLPWLRWRAVGRVDAADELPEHLPRRGVMLVGPQAKPTWAVFDCPCRQRHRIMLNLDASRRPRWQVTNLAPLTVAPSIDAITATRRCHFWVRDGRIRWV